MPLRICIHMKQNPSRVQYDSSVQLAADRLHLNNDKPAADVFMQGFMSLTTHTHMLSY